MMASGDGPVGIIAGGHDLPIEVADALLARGQDCVVFGLVGEADSRIEAYRHEWLRWGEIGRLFSLLEQMKISSVLCIGSIVNRPNFKTLKLDMGTLKALPEILRIMARGGDEGVLGGVDRFFQKRGVRIVSVPEIVPALVVGADLSVGGALDPIQEADLALAAKAAHMIGSLDAGQGAVVAAGRVLALEGPEGTDQMLERVALIREQGRAQWDFGYQGLLLKRARPGQNLRFDMPAIGPRTLEKVKAAGLSGIVCSQGEVLCINKACSMAFARQAGLFIKACDLSKLD